MLTAIELAPTIALPTGARMPLVGLGTWKPKEPEEIENAVRTALEIGYRLIDTAFIYRNEANIGKVLHEYLEEKKKLKRDELFNIKPQRESNCDLKETRPLFFTGHRPEDVEKMLRDSLKALQLDYVDLYLIHGPFPFKRQTESWEAAIEDGKMVPELTDLSETWKAMEAVFSKGLAKAIGLSNFNAKQIQQVYDRATVETHLHWPQNELHDLCKKLRITFTAYAPIGSPGRRETHKPEQGVAARPDNMWPAGDWCTPIEEPVVKGIASKQGKTPAQILLRQLVQRGISVIPKSRKSGSPQRMKEKFQIFDFTLSGDEMKALSEARKSNFWHDFYLRFNAKDHPFYPHERAEN